MNSRIAIKIMLCLLISVTIFHVSIMLKIIPYEITWGGRLKNDAEMYVFETVSILINLFLLSLLLIKGSYVKQFIPIKVVNIILWVFIVLFALNTVGNIIAETMLEKCFALLTMASAILIWVILRKDKNQL